MVVPLLFIAIIGHSEVTEDPIVPAFELGLATPAVIVFHGYEGRTDFEDLKARDLALFGYVAFAVDIYGFEGNETYNLSTASDLLSKRTTTLRRRILAAWELLKGLSFVDDQKVAVLYLSMLVLI
ncbi:hypothetical protein KIN20_024511, partial [Parelaphostrongylus tenuis]